MCFGPVSLVSLGSRPGLREDLRGGSHQAAQRLPGAGRAATARPTPPKCAVFLWGKLRNRGGNVGRFVTSQNGDGVG